MKESTKIALKELAKCILTALIAFITAILSSSCGTTRAVVTNKAEQTNTEIKITTNNPSTISVDPNTTIDLYKK
ncbi:hypothetical protein [Capybara microvirus Cap1_SP_123]|nr:hypothetical protein [Capybara microvirus Cap1_SP_123]